MLLAHPFALFLPWYFEEEGEIDEAPDPDEAVVDEDDKEAFLKALRRWFHQERRKSYKFIGLFLTNDITEFEIKMRSHMEKHRALLRDESGGEPAPHSNLSF